MCLVSVTAKILELLVFYSDSVSDLCYLILVLPSLSALRSSCGDSKYYSRIVWKNHEIISLYDFHPTND